MLLDEGENQTRVSCMGWRANSLSAASSSGDAAACSSASGARGRAGAAHRRVLGVERVPRAVRMPPCEPFRNPKRSGAAGVSHPLKIISLHGARHAFTRARLNTYRPYRH